MFQWTQQQSILRHTVQFSKFKTQFHQFYRTYIVLSNQENHGFHIPCFYFNDDGDCDFRITVQQGEQFTQRYTRAVAIASKLALWRYISPPIPKIEKTHNSEKQKNTKYDAWSSRDAAPVHLLLKAWSTSQILTKSNTVEKYENKDRGSRRKNYLSELWRSTWSALITFLLHVTGQAYAKYT